MANGSGMSEKAIGHRSGSELKLRNEKLLLLSEIASLLLLSDDPRVILDSVFRMLSAHLGLEAYFNYLVTDDGSRMRLYEYGGIAGDVAKAIEWLDYGQAVCGCVARDRERIIAEDVQRSSDPRTDLIRSLGITAYCCHPLIAHEKLIGTLSFGTRNRTRFGDDEVELMRTACNLVATALERAQLISRLKNSRAELEVRIKERSSELREKQEELETQAGELRASNAALKTRVRERDQAEAALRESKVWLGAVFQSMSDAVLISDADGNFLDFNEAFATCHRFRNKEECYRTLSEYPDYIDVYFVDGSPAPLDMWAVPRALRGETVANAEYILRRKDTGETWWGSYSFGPIRDRDGGIVGSVVVGRDITEGKLAEEALKEARMRAELYLDLVGHDISNMHQIIEGQLELAQEIMAEEGKLDGGDKDLIDLPLQTLLRSNKLIDNVRKLQKIGAGEYRSGLVDIGGVLDEVVSKYSKIPGKDISIDYAPVHGYSVEANPLLKDVFTNLVDNAITHSSGSARIGIDVTPAVDGGTTYYRVAIEDNGSGIPDAKKDEIFHRLRRGPAVMRGTGLGLYIVKTLVESFNGRVVVEDRVPGDHTKGSRFLVYLPVAEDETSG